MHLQLLPELKYYDTVTLRHKDTKVLLHSHPERYPLRYDDGRISSQGMARPSDYLCDAHV
jgi:dolichyl-phosphate-mannose--protein O-mannosyl transferase